MEPARQLVILCRKHVACLAALAACVLAGTGCSSSPKPNPTYPEVSLAKACPSAVSPNNKPAITVHMDQAADALSATVGTRIVAISAKRYPIKFSPARLGCLVSSRLRGRNKHRVTEFIVTAPGRARIFFVIVTGLIPVHVRITR